MKEELAKAVKAHGESVAEKSAREAQVAKLTREKEEAERQVKQLDEQVKASTSSAGAGLKLAQEELAACKTQVLSCVYCYRICGG